MPYVSLSRSGPHLVTVIADRPVGVDVEAAAIDVHPALVLAPGETGDLARALGCGKEAVLKLRGTGLSDSDVRGGAGRRELARPTTRPRATSPPPCSRRGA